MESDISEAKLHATLKTMEINKLPGEDGYSAEFYNLFWIDIKGMLLDTYRYAKKGLLSTTDRIGINWDLYPS